jgi:hypothetical protein
MVIPYFIKKIALKKTSILLLYLFFSFVSTHAQRNFVIDNKGTLIESHNLVTTATNPPSNPIHGDVWFGSNVAKIWDGTIWKTFLGNIIGDLKYGFETIDHDGWVMLDGRAITTLEATQQTEAASLGFSGNIPDARDRTLMMRNTGVIGDLGGDATVPILQGNLPNLLLVATLVGGGIHRHSYNDFNPSYTRQRGSGANILLTTEVTTTRTSTTNGDHSHTVSVSSGGSDTPTPISPPFLQTNVFIFLDY